MYVCLLKFLLNSFPSSEMSRRVAESIWHMAHEKVLSLVKVSETRF
jgi:hypothetical protein